MISPFAKQKLQAQTNLNIVDVSSSVIKGNVNSRSYEIKWTRGTRAKSVRTLKENWDLTPHLALSWKCATALHFYGAFTDLTKTHHGYNSRWEITSLQHYDLIREDRIVTGEQEWRG